MPKRATTLSLALVPLALGLRVPQAVSRRAFAVGVAASSSACLPAFADNEDAPLYDVAGNAAERIKSEGLVKSTGKPVPGWLIGAIGVGAATAIGLNAFSSPKPDTPLPTGLFSEPNEEAYEESRWVNNVDLPWLKQEEEESADAEDEQE